MLRYLLVAAVLSCIPASAEDWQSPTDIDSYGGHLTHSDCQRYGARYGYNECPGGGSIQSTAHSARRPSPVIVAFHRAKKIPSIIRYQIQKDIETTHIHQRNTAMIQVAFKMKNKFATCANAMDQCYQGCRGPGVASPVKGSLCNSYCRTEKVCSLPIKADYGEFLNFQIELLAVPVTKRADVASSHMSRIR